eukprot:2169030-Pyramimonas_sp.AAC.1
MFAGDATPLATPRQALAIMLAEIQEEWANVGLNLYADACSVQCLGKGAVTGQKIKLVGEECPETSSAAGFKVLGANVTMDGTTLVEFEARPRAGWAKFASLSHLLAKRSTSQTKRLHLFNSTVPKTVP